jgi:hypothetical protein
MLQAQAILLRDGRPRPASSMIFAKGRVKQELTREEIKDA